MNKSNASSNEQISALVDGCLQGEACAHALNAVLADEQAVQTWHAYQVVGDVLRSAELAPSHSDLAFWEKLERRLAQEPQRPQMLADDHVAVSPANVAAAVVDTDRPGANAAVFRWKMLATSACVALAGVVGMGLWTQTGQPTAAQMAVATPPAAPEAPQLVTADSSAGTMVRDPRLDELMAAHRQLGGHSALQVPAGFLRNATYEGAAR
jgi:sigma-E factor negative regulatory protein RseA